MPVLTDVTWRASANCASVDPELFFPDKGAHPARAKKVCGGCTVRTECLTESLTLGFHASGIWGGLSEKQRRPLLRQRKLAA